ncbi:MAG: hypothetical protein M1816_008060 [Peltula sp. TS41687]|nr:MAG: hypothetical protein M1816_008060 [Peltula sp. TS41687]
MPRHVPLLRSEIVDDVSPALDVTHSDLPIRLGWSLAVDIARHHDGVQSSGPSLFAPLSEFAYYALRAVVHLIQYEVVLAADRATSVDASGG